jgi:hypothetical protein
MHYNLTRQADFVTLKKSPGINGGCLVIPPPSGAILQGRQISVRCTTGRPGVNSVVIPADLFNSNPNFMPKEKTGFETTAYKNIGVLDDPKSG